MHRLVRECALGSVVGAAWRIAKFPADPPSFSIPFPFPFAVSLAPPPARRRLPRCIYIDAQGHARYQTIYIGVLQNLWSQGLRLAPGCALSPAQGMH